MLISFPEMSAGHVIAPAVAKACLHHLELSPVSECDCCLANILQMFMGVLLFRCSLTDLNVVL